MDLYLATLELSRFYLRIGLVMTNLDFKIKENKIKISGKFERQKMFKGVNFPNYFIKSC